jgi:hypothetical protein
MHTRAFSFPPVARIVAKSGRRVRRLEPREVERREGNFPSERARCYPFPTTRGDGHLFHLRCSRPVPGLRRSPFFGSGDARAGDKRDLSQVRPRLYHKDRHRNRARVGRREEAQRPPSGSRKLKSDHGFVDYRTYQAAGGTPWLRDKCAAIRRRRSQRLSGTRRKRAAQLSRRSLWHGSKSSPDRTHSARRTNRTTGVRGARSISTILSRTGWNWFGTGARRTDAPAQIPGPYHGDDGFALRTREASVVLASSSERVYA